MGEEKGSVYLDSKTLDSLASRLSREAEHCVRGEGGRKRGGMMQEKMIFLRCVLFSLRHKLGGKTKTNLEM